MHRCGRLWKTPETSSRPSEELLMTSCPPRYYFKAGYMEEGLAALRDLGSDYFKSPYPSTTCIEVVRVAWADHLLEIEAVAILGGQTE
jgi:hypothetical protein